MPDFKNCAAVRAHLVEALEADLIGPFAKEGTPEILELPPTRWYLTGFLVPEGRSETQDDPTEQEDLSAGDDVSDEEAGTSEPSMKRPGRLPASIGLSVFLPSGPSSEQVMATVTYADYLPHETVEPGKKGREIRKVTWERVPRQPVRVPVPLDAALLAAGVTIPDSGGLVLVGQLREAKGGTSGLVEDVRMLALFLVNRRPIAEDGWVDEQTIFQVSLELSFDRGLIGRQNIRGEDDRQWDERLADLHFRERLEHAVGHGISVETKPDSSGRVTTARTCWIPAVTVPTVVTRPPGKTVVSMEALADLKDGAAVRSALGSLVADYSQWLGEQRVRRLSSRAREQTRDDVLAKAEHACRRIEAGLSLLENDAQVREAFCLANRAMAMASRKRRPQEEPKWHLFQLAFQLLNLSGIADEQHPDRECVELIFFPTGGGKTEAYLGVIAFLLGLRRLRSTGRPDKGLGVAVLLRYTLRLLTLDQLGRAAGLICALELLRRGEPAKLGDVRFSIGLWVGRSATANRLSEVAARITAYRTNASPNASPPCPLTECPWCRAPFKTISFTLIPNQRTPTGLVVGCGDPKCEFNTGKNPAGLPILYVDEQLYRELPSFVIATVDKFALLPWRGETGMFFGRAEAMAGGQFFGPGQDAPAGAVSLPDGLRPPELILQDELHLISGPLGTMVGLYETAIETLASRPGPNGRVVKPKIIASTATVRRADEQVRALFGRSTTAIFPPAGVDDSETFFAEVDGKGDGRLYLGVSGPGRSMKAVLLRTYIALLGAAQHAFESCPEGEAADPYMTLAGYFNSLRELGGMRRLVEDEIRARTGQVGQRKPLTFTGASPWFSNRALQLEPVELTSREKTTAIASSKARLTKKHRESEHVDVLLASNMISVGVDIDRLGLMVVAGQPKSTSEYIQASSRVGRKRDRPGLVVTVLNTNRPRDRSHYERFSMYHRSFYRSVEATSVTPFSGPALERAFAAVLVAMTRLGTAGMTPPAAVMDISTFRSVAEEALERVAERAARVEGGSREVEERRREAIRGQGRNILDAWVRLMDESRKEAAAERRYSPFESGTRGKPLLKEPLEKDEAGSSDEMKFSAPTSMRDVERTVDLWIERRELGGRAVSGGK